MLTIMPIEAAWKRWKDLVQLVLSWQALKLGVSGDAGWHQSHQPAWKQQSTATQGPKNNLLRLLSNLSSVMA